MRFVKLMAAAAALGCAGMAAQAQATVILGTATGTVTLDSTGAATVQLSTARCGRCRITITAPGATFALPEFLYTYHVTPYRPSNFTPYDKTVPIPVTPTGPLSFFAYEPNGYGTSPYRPAKVIPGLAPAGQRSKSYIVGLQSASVQFGGTPDSTIDYAVTVSSAPEPATWALMMLGLGTVGAAMRRSRQSRCPSTTNSLSRRHS